MSVLAVIPARGGSKSIPRKNIKLLAGRPLLAWTIEAARAAQLVDRVVVSTDDAAIATVATAYGAEVIARPAELATDTASSESALLHALDYLQESESYRPEVVAFLQCTAPLITPADVDGTVRLVCQEGYDSAVTMAPFHYFLWRDAGDGQMMGVNHEATRRLRRQDREPEYQEVGAVYAMRAAGLEEHRFRFFGRIGKHLISPARAFELDEPGDWIVAEALMQRLSWTQLTGAPTAHLPSIKAIVTDFDGVLTDNRVAVDQEGVESVVCNRGDGWGIDLLKEAGILVACVSTETNPVVAARCRKLDIPYWQGQQNKLAALTSFLSTHELELADCLYIGNDTNDLACLQSAGVAVVPGDAAPEAKAVAAWVTEAAGGEGVLREVARLLIQAREARAA